MSFVPAEWTRMIGNLRTALLARDAMKAPEAQPPEHDAATARYCRAVDAVIEDLGLLSERQVLGRITLLLARKDRA
ncbi:hypothetical protein RNZ50_15825 [Paracoccaceae bacterium Fryx2]|nr:hypothetical protein [Paracoccaceae bacterium Fryx2]